MLKVYVTRPLPEKVLSELSAIAELDVRQETSGLTASEMNALMANYEVILCTLGDMAQDFSGALKCKLLANFGVGYNHIDATAAGAAGIAVTNTPGAVTDATADIAMTLILMTARRAGEGERVVRAGQWQGWHPTQFLGTHVSGKTVGIIGMGRIGQAIARRCHFGFGMDVVYYNRSPKELDFPATRLDQITDVMAAADFISLSTPGGAGTQHLIGQAELSAMKPTGFLINTSRGEVIDEAALVAALHAGAIAGAGLDVYEHEPNVSSELLKMDNVTLLPHLGTAALNVREEMGLMAVKNIRAYVTDQKLPNLVT
ncbi:MAG: D-glycerate dehydrogenase [Pseudomonadota bacterium]